MPFFAWERRPKRRRAARRSLKSQLSRNWRRTSTFPTPIKTPYAFALPQCSPIGLHLAFIVALYDANSQGFGSVFFHSLTIHNLATGQRRGHSGGNKRGSRPREWSRIAAFPSDPEESFGYVPSIHFWIAAPDPAWNPSESSMRSGFGDPRYREPECSRLPFFDAFAPPPDGLDRMLRRRGYPSPSFSDPRTAKAAKYSIRFLTIAFRTVFRRITIPAWESCVRGRRPLCSRETMFTATR